MNRITFAAALAAFVAAAPAMAQHRPVPDLDVAGVRLHASPAEARAALLRAGYRIDYTSEAATFDQQVAAEAARRKGAASPGGRQAGMGQMVATGPHQEQLQVAFMQTPRGSEVSDVNLRVPAEAITAEDFRAQLTGKYGNPDAARFQGAELSWCSPETVANCGRQTATSGPLDDQYPLLSGTAYGRTDDRLLRLQIGETAFPALARVREQAVERLAPKTTRAAF